MPNNYYNKHEIKDGCLQKIAVKESVVEEDKIQFPKGFAVVTHVGAYGRIKFLYNGKTYKSYGSPRALEHAKKLYETEEDVLHSNTAGDNHRTNLLASSEDGGREVIFYGWLDFNITAEEMLDLFINCYDGTTHWVAV